MAGCVYHALPSSEHRTDICGVVHDYLRTWKTMESMQKKVARLPVELCVQSGKQHRHVVAYHTRRPLLRRTIISMGIEDNFSHLSLPHAGERWLGANFKQNGTACDSFTDARISVELWWRGSNRQNTAKEPGFGLMSTSLATPG